VKRIYQKTRERGKLFPRKLLSNVNPAPVEQQWNCVLCVDASICAECLGYKFIFDQPAPLLKRHRCSPPQTR
jgi:hypothetical protein